MNVPVPHNEPQRLEALRKYHILDTPPDEAIDDLTRIASQICGTPVAMVSLIDDDRQWFKSKIGVDVEETRRDMAFCAHTILQNDLMIVPDTQTDERFAHNPFVQDSPNVRFYAGASLVDPDGHALGSLCVLDLKPRELNEDQQNALRSLSRQVVAQFELRRAVEDLGRLLGQKDEFLRIASHDLKNPLTVVNASAKVLEMIAPAGTELSADAHGIISRISKQAQLMQRIIEDYLDAAAIQDGQIQLNIALNVLNDIANDALEANTDYASSKNTELVLELDENLPTAPFDKDRIEQVALNFVSNAIKFSPKGSRVVLRTLRKDGRVALEVSDSGPGINAEDSKKVFQKYARLQNKPTGGEKSSGLGLAICKELVELHPAGRCGFRNNPEGGSTFWLSLTLPG